MNAISRNVLTRHGLPRGIASLAKDNMPILAPRQAWLLLS